MISLQCENETLIIEWEKHVQTPPPKKSNDNNKKNPKTFKYPQILDYLNAQHIAEYLCMSLQVYRYRHNCMDI